MTTIEVDHSSLTMDLGAYFDALDPPELVLDGALSADDLDVLCRSVAGSGHADWVFERVATHAAANESILRLILSFSKDESVANTIVTAPRTSIALLKQLSTSPHSSVREHAIISLVAREILPRRDSQELHKLLDGSQGNKGAALGVRWFIAQYAGTPRDVLLRLANDEADVVASAARKNLNE